MSQSSDPCEGAVLRAVSTKDKVVVVGEASQFKLSSKLISFRKNGHRATDLDAAKQSEQSRALAKSAKLRH
jgi:hypothetical protein